MVEISNRGQKKAREARRIARRDRRREQSREEILDAAERVLLEDGLAGFTVDAVAKEVELTKAALYYYFPNKDGLLFDLMFRLFSAEAQAIHDAVEQTNNGADALKAIVRAVIEHYRDRIEQFRLVYMHAQVAGPGLVKPDAEQLQRIRPLNDLMYLGAQQRLEKDRACGLLRDDADPRRLAFVAHMSAIGVLTMKGMVEGAGDPLIHSDDALIGELEIAFGKSASQ